MVKPVKWLNTALSLYFVFFGLAAKAQLEPLNSIKTDEDIVSFSVDRTGNIFLGLTSGTIKKLSGTLDSLVVYNPTRVGAFTLLEAWHGFQVFAFNQKFQDFILLDRFLTQENRYDLGATGLFYIDLATISGDQNLWLLEENSLRLMKYDFRTGETILNVIIDPWLDSKNHDFSFLREYQNLLFLTDKESGTYVFDNFGNFLRKLETGKANHIAFYDEWLFYIEDKQLIQESLYAQQQKQFPLPQDSLVGILVQKNMVYLIGNRKVDRILIPAN